MPDDSAAPAPRPLRLEVADDVVLDAEVHVPADAVARVVLAHPHPQQGGTMRSGLVAELFRRLPERGVAVLRFDFRGVGASTGTHDHGRGEADDLLAAVHALDAATGSGPLAVCGWSFGADVSLAVLDGRIAAWVPVAPPLMVRPLEELAAAAGADPRPKVLLVPEHDQFRPPEAARAATAGWTATTVQVVPGADHFLVGRAEAVAELVAAAVTGLA